MTSASGQKREAGLDPGDTDSGPAGAAHTETVSGSGSGPAGATRPETVSGSGSGPGGTGNTETEAPPGAPGTAKNDVVAVAAITFGALALVPFALVAGIVALARTRSGRRGGRAMAITGIMLAGVWTLAGASVAAVILTHPRRPAPVQHHRPLAGTVFGVRTGQCVNTAPNGIDAAHVVPCSQPHDIEVYATFRARGHKWPGATAMAAQASQGCVSRLSSYLNPQFDTGLTESYVYPDRGAWLAGERTVVCEIHSASGKTTGSVRGLGQ